MEKAEIIKQLTELHDRMAYGGQIIPDRKLIQALCEGIGWMEEADVNEIGIMKTMYFCDGRACKDGCNRRSLGRCTHTTNPLHARNFILLANGLLIEKIDPNEIFSPVSHNDVIVEV